MKNIKESSSKKQEENRILYNININNTIDTEIIKPNNEESMNKNIEGNEIVYITDTGYIKSKLLKEYQNKNIYIIESNYEEEMLRNGSYPYHLKQRIRSDRGHISNDDTCSYLKKIIGKNTKYIMLAHLSEENNNPELVISNMKKLKTEVNNNIKEIKIYSQEEKNITNL